MKQIIIKFMIATMFLTSIGCGFLGIGNSVDPSLRTHVQSFEEEYDTRVNFPVKVVENGSLEKPNDSLEKIGRCFQKDNLFPTSVKVEQRAVKNMTHMELQGLVYHELAHCKFDVGHDNSMIKDLGIPKSLMHAEGDAYDHYKYNEDYYNDELRGKISNTFLGNLNGK